MRYKSIVNTIESLVGLSQSNMLVVNREYQRGEKWSRPQKQLFIDSIMRGYPVPVIFLHVKKETVNNIGGEKVDRETYEIIDGQQRINALRQYVDGEYSLLDPSNEQESKKFLNFMKTADTPWAGKLFDALNLQLRKNFLEKEISVICIEHAPNSKHEARELFIRLQAGSALNDQEKRDAWPGDFTDFIFKVGGKYDLPGNPGHDFFPEVMHITSSRTDGGKVRKIAAQMYLLCNSYTEGKRFPSIKKESLDDLYRTNGAFPADGGEAKRFLKCLDTLLEIFGDGYSPKMQNHDVFHLALFVYSLLEDDYVESKWKGGLKKAHEAFREKCAKAKLIESDEERAKNEYVVQYLNRTRTAADAPDTIARRHEFFSRKMSAHMRERDFLISKDPQRHFTSVEREVIYFRDDTECLVCEARVVWRDAEIHHVERYSDGGQTTLDNGALVHRNCHPKSRENEEKYARKFRAKREAKKVQSRKRGQKERQVDLPAGTEARGFLGSTVYVAKIDPANTWKGIDHEGKRYIAKTPSGAAKAATGKSMNGWKFWEVKRPDDENWRPLDDL